MRNDPTIRLRELKHLFPSQRVLERAKETLGAEPKLDARLAQKAAGNDIDIASFGLVLSKEANRSVAVRLVEICLDLLDSLTDSMDYTELDEKISKAIYCHPPIAKEILDLYEKSAALAIASSDAIIKKAYKGLGSALLYLARTDLRNKNMVDAASNCILMLASIEAKLVQIETKAPLYNLFVKAYANQKKARAARSANDFVDPYFTPPRSARKANPA